MRFFIVAALTTVALFGQQPDFDLVITGGQLVDGAGGPCYYAGIGVRGDSIVAVGRLGGRNAARTVDAKGRVVAPGFIDIHTHAQRRIFQDPAALQ
jgi:N-acyl-D-aspartate/D-glutamate deacylase